jgi:hypothetical protein
MRVETHLGIVLHEKRPLLLSDFNQNWRDLQILLKFLHVKFHENQFSSSRVVPCFQTDGKREILIGSSQIYECAKSNYLTR